MTLKADPSVVFLMPTFVMMYWCFRLLLSFQFCNGVCLPCAQRLFDNWRIPRNGRCRPTLHGRTGRILVHCRIHFPVTNYQWKKNLCYWAYVSFAFNIGRLWSSGCRSRYQGFLGRLKFLRRPFCVIGNLKFKLPFSWTHLNSPRLAYLLILTRQRRVQCTATV